MSSRRAGSVLLHHLGPRVFGPAAAAPRPLLSLAGGGQGGSSTAWVRLLSISASEARADVAEVYASNEDYASSKAQAATIAASEARADVAEVYASKVDYANIVEVKSAVAEEASKPKKGDWKAEKPAFVSASAGAVEAHASKENSGSVAVAKAEVAEAARDGEFNKGKKAAESSYWGIAPSTLVNKDGVEWKWSCFKVSTTHSLLCHQGEEVASNQIACATNSCSLGRRTRRTPASISPGTTSPRSCSTRSHTGPSNPCAGPLTSSSR